jgi:putative ATP-binding cassette transporter
MGLIKLLWKESATSLCAALAASAACALVMMTLLRLVSQYIGDPSHVTIGAPLFASLALAMAGLQLASTALINQLASRTVGRLRTALVEKISNASLVALERVGTARLATSLGEEQVRIGSALPAAVALTRDLVFIAAGLAYLAWLSPTVFGVLALALGSGYLLYRPLQTRAVRRMQLLARSGGHLFSLCRNLVDGARQLKLANTMALPLKEALDEEERVIHRLATGSGFLFAAANCLAVLYFVALLAVMIFGHIADFVQPGLVTTYTMILFFMLAPLQNVGGLIQGLSQAGVSLQGIDEISRTLSGDEPATARSLPASPVTPAVLGIAGANAADIPPPASSTEELAQLPRIQRIECRKLAYEYASEERQHFALSPVDFSVRAGEVAFVVGGNGSGKTTFLKVLCGLYAPTSGGIYVDGTLLDSTNVPAYRRQINAVFSDNCLFDGLTGSQYEKALGEQTDLIKRLRLEHAVRPGSGILAQSSSFSSGERKRMALLLGSQSDSQIVVFDEFAADQDPEAKEYFYYEILKDLKERGKIVIAVTHDDRYFNVADQVLVLERGMQAGVRKQSAARKPVQVLRG